MTKFFNITRTAKFTTNSGMGLYDAQDREIGYRYSLETREYDAGTGSYVAGSEWDCETLANSRKFAMQFRTTRGGKDFGPVQHWELFDTASERMDALEAKLAGARKRAHKLAGVEMLVA